MYYIYFSLPLSVYYQWRGGCQQGFSDLLEAVKTDPDLVARGNYGTFTVKPWSGMFVCFQQLLPEAWQFQASLQQDMFGLPLRNATQYSVFIIIV